MGKHSILEDEVPLTLPSPSRPVMQETRSRFDHLLRVALSQEKKEKRKKRHKEKIENIELPVRSGRSLGELQGQHNEAFTNEMPKTSSSRKHTNKLPLAHNDNQLYGAHNRPMSTATFASGVEHTSSSDDDVHVIKQKNDINNGADENSMVPQPKPRKKRVSEDTRTENQALDDKAVDSGRNRRSEKDFNRISSKSFESNSESDVKNEDFDDSHKQERRLSYVIQKANDSSSTPSFRRKMSPEFERPTPLPNKDFDDSHKQERRLSYVIQKANDSSSTPSFRRKMSPEFERPTPLPRIKTAKGKQKPLPDVHNVQSSQHSAREVLEQNSSHNVSTSSPNITAENVQAPPLYSRTSASYENLEKDGGPVVKVHKVLKTRSKIEVGEEIEMQTLRLSAPVASYEEITPSRKSRLQDPSSPEREARVLISARPSTSARSDRESSDLNYEKIIGVIVHKCDVLQMDTLVRHPLVKVYIVDSFTGEYMKKSDPKRSVSYFNEQDDVDYVVPLMTHEFNFLARRSMVPCWEELLIFNEDITCIMKNDAPVIILFEILDFVSFAMASTQYKKLGPEGGWHKVAWGFLKPVGANGKLNIGEQRRLQLYKPQEHEKADCDNCAVYSWWNRGDWKKYPGTIYVTVKGIQPPENLPPVFRSKVALQGEIFFSTDLSIDEDRDNSKSDDIALPSTSENNNPMNSSPVRAVTWSRMAAQSCKVPNKRTMTLPTASKGCFTLKFSNAGLYLACATLSKSVYTILVYAIPDGKEFAQLTGHQGLIYDLNWSSSDKHLLSASSDSTACIWSIKGKKHTQLVQMLPHPSFVYCARFLAKNDNVVITGCNDHVVRIWSKARRSALFQLVQEYEEHKGFVTALCFDRDGMLISGDSVGRIIVWPSLTHSHFSAKSLRDLSLRELQDTVINSLVLHPGGQRLLVHARDNLLRMIDLATASIIQWFHGALNYRVQSFACITPCGGMVLAASEDGTVRVWNADTGDQVAIYSGLQFSTGSSGVDYHPFEHMAAFSSTGSPVGVALCSYDKSADSGGIGLAILANQPLAPNVDQKVDVEHNQSKVRLPPIPGDALKLSRKNKYHHMGKDVSNSIVETADESSISGFSQSSHSFLTSTRVSNRQQKSDAQSNNKLSNIIDKIDQVLSSTTHSKTNSHVSNTSTPKKEDQEAEALEMKKETEKRSSARSRRQALN